MLVLSRKLGEKIRIGNEIEVEVLSVRGSRVRLGFTCPIEIPIRRSELEFEETSALDSQWTSSDPCEFQYARIDSTQINMQSAGKETR
jgi:carbon storage regulator